MQDPVLTPIFIAAGVTGGITIGTATVSFASILSAATVIGAAVAVNYVMQPDAPKPEQGTIPLRQTVPPRISGFGEVRLAGNYVFYEIGAFAVSCDILALCQGPIGGYKRFYMDDLPVVIESTTGQPTSGAWGNFAYMATSVYANKGYSPNSAWTPDGLGGIWNADHRGDGVASLFLRSANQPQAQFQKYYPHGLPKPSAALFLPCWDFRDGAQSPDNQNTWINYPQWQFSTAYAVGDRVMHGGIGVPGIDPAHVGGMLWLCLAANTGIEPTNTQTNYWAPVWKNPVLQVVTFLISQSIGMGLPRERIITPALASLTAQAALCDEPVFDSLGNFEPRYTSNAWWKLETDPSEILAQMLAACDGWLSIDGEGALAMRVGVFEPPTVTLDESCILSVELSYGATDEEKVDELTLSYTSPAQHYTTQAVDSWRDEDAILTRGKVRSQAFGPASVHSATQVRRLAKRIFLRNNSIKGSLTTHLGGMIAAGQRYVAVSYPLIPELDGAVIELRRRETDLAARQCRFEFCLVDAELLDGWTPIEEGPPPVTPLPPIQPEELPVPEDVTIVEDAGPPFTVLVSWDFPVGRSDLDWRVRYRVIGTVEWSQQTFTDLVPSAGRMTAPMSLAEGIAYEIGVASVGTLGTESLYSASVYVGVTPVSAIGTAAGVGAAAGVSAALSVGSSPIGLLLLMMSQS